MTEETGSELTLHRRALKLLALLFEPKFRTREQLPTSQRMSRNEQIELSGNLDL